MSECIPASKQSLKCAKAPSQPLCMPSLQQKHTSDTALKSLCEPESPGHPRSPSNGELIKSSQRQGLKLNRRQQRQHTYLSGHCVCGRVHLNVSNISCAYQVHCSALCIETLLWHKGLQILWWQKAQGYPANTTDTFYSCFTLSNISAKGKRPRKRI